MKGVEFSDVRYSCGAVEPKNNSKKTPEMKECEPGVVVGVSFAPVEVSITKRINSSDSCYEWSPPNFFLIIHLERETRRRRGKGGEAKGGKAG